MLLGIVLHAAMSFLGGVWSVEDIRAGSEFFWWLVFGIHGFRMQLFFLLSGFFTSMVWKKRGLNQLVRHRFKRIFLPLLICFVTIIPLMNWVSEEAAVSEYEKTQNIVAFIFLDDADKNNGCMRIVPKTHKKTGWIEENLKDKSFHKDEIFLDAQKSSIILMDANLWHSGTTNSNGNRRRVAGQDCIFLQHRADGGIDRFLDLFVLGGRLDDQGSRAAHRIDQAAPGGGNPRPACA